MALPEATLTINDGQLGLVPQDTSGIQALIGTCSTGTVSEINEFGSIEAVQDEYGVGPLVEAAALVFAAGAGPVICCKATSNTAGAASAVTHTGTGTSVVTVAGNANDAYDVIIKIKTAAAAVTSGLGVFVFSLDGGVSYSDALAVPVAATYLLPDTGLTITFAAGTLVVDDTYTFTSTGPSYSLTNLNTAMTALLADSRTWFLVHAVGEPADAAASAAIFSALDTKMTAAAAVYRYAMAVFNAADDTDANLLSAFSSLNSTRVAVCAGYAMITSPVSGSSFERPASWIVCPRAGSVSPSTDLAYVGDGPLTGVTELLRDEFVTQGLDAARFTTLRTHVGLPGFYITNARMMCSPSSDFRYWQHRRVMDIAAGTARAGMLVYLNGSVRVYPPGHASAGKIREEDARSIEMELLAKLRATVTQPGYASSVSVQVDRTNNILSTSELKLSFGIVPLGYTKTITGTIGFNNPALAQA